MKPSSAGAPTPRKEDFVSSRNEKQPDLPSKDTEEPALVKDQKARRQPATYPDPVDDGLDDSFPVSDPPSWTGR